MNLGDGVEEIASNESHRFRFLQVDIMKATMILFVILDHGLSEDVKSRLFIQFWLRLSVPLFLIIMGFNYARSFSEKGLTSFREVYSRRYFSQKSRRYLNPFLIFFIPLTLLSVILEALNLRFLSSRGILPFWGPGLWYIPVIVSAVLILPLLYHFSIRHPRLTLALSLVIEISMHLLLYSLTILTEPDPIISGSIMFIVQSNILLYLTSIGLGVWLSSDHGLTSQRNRFILFLMPFSLTYLTLYTVTGDRFALLKSDYNFFLVPYAAIIFLLLMRIFPQKTDIVPILNFSKIGKASYNIFLLQSMMFSILYTQLV